MKLSHTMLNFLGYHSSDENMFAPELPKYDLEGFLSHFGAVAALKNSLVKPSTGPVYDAGYHLTDLGIELGEIGQQMREDRAAFRGSAAADRYIAQAQELLNTRQETKDVHGR